MPNAPAPLPLTKLLSSELLAQVKGDISAMPAITGFAQDSRAVKPGFVFAALQGVASDGHAYIKAAEEAGAAFILLSDDTIKPRVPYIKLPQPRTVLGEMAARFYAPAPKQLLAVTGTNGKTSVAHFCRQLWQTMGIKAASMGTLGVIGNKGEVLEAGAMTTPGVIDFHRILHDLQQSGIEHVALEASSHGLEQQRMEGVRISVGAFTNLTHDHLDYHGTMQAYGVAKEKLFTEMMQKGGTAILNADDAYSAIMAQRCKAHGINVQTYGYAGKEFTIKQLHKHPGHMQAELVVFGVPHSVTVPLVGEFQLYNVLCATAMLHATGIAIEKLLGAYGSLTGVPGRLQKVGARGTVYIDYAHTPDALERVLKVLREHVPPGGKLWVVFGCGGDRDAAKRPEMGRIASSLADNIVVTDDNPRTENGATIRQQIMAACKGAVEIADRKLAIEHALKEAGEKDTVLIAGKGHEDYQIIGTVKHPFSDKEVAEEVLSHGK